MVKICAWFLFGKLWSDFMVEVEVNWEMRGM